MLTMGTIKEYLREDESDYLLEILLDYSIEEIYNSTGLKATDVTIDEIKAGETKTYQLCQLVIITDRFENRSSQDLTPQAQNILSNLYAKLKYAVELKVEEDEVTS